jgi:membrane protein DedA with SNARE-associated domain
MHGFSEAVLAFTRAHGDLAPLIVGLLSFGESLAFVSLVVPATTILLGSGALFAAADITFLPVWAGAAIGAFLGDWLSFWLGRHFKDRIRWLWPFSRHPALLVSGRRFFARYGTFGVFLGRFFGPLRSVVPIVAGVSGMPPLPFQIANIASALIWAAAMLAPGTLAVNWLG